MRKHTGPLAVSGGDTKGAGGSKIHPVHSRRLSQAGQGCGKGMKQFSLKG